METYCFGEATLLKLAMASVGKTVADVHSYYVEPEDNELVVVVLEPGDKKPVQAVG